MAQPAQVLFQSGGSGFVVFAGQSVPAAAIRADELRRLHDLARSAMVHAKANDTHSAAFRTMLQDLHQELATMMLDLQDTGRRHGFVLPLKLQVNSKDFLAFDDSHTG
jgi:hypothetical protein